MPTTAPTGKFAVEVTGGTVVCKTCQQVNPPGARFCFNCGAALEAGAPATGERRMVTIMFADVVGSTAWAENVDPEEWAEIMNNGLRPMIAAVNRYEGTVARLMGDGLLALFGAPVAHEDDAERAVRAALAIRTAAEEYSRELEPRYGSEFAVRVGINTGLSVVTSVGDETKAEYTAMGDAANLAARLQGLAPPQGIVIGPETYALVRHAFEVRPRGSETIRGRSGSVEAYEVVRPLDSASVRRGLEGMASPFVGRDAELAVLRSAVQRAREGQAGVLFVVGEAGLGKSRLLAELKEREPDVTWLEGRAISYAGTAPYHPWRQPLLHSLRPESGAADEDLGQRLRALHLTALGEGAREDGAAEPPWFGALLTLLGLDGPAAEPPGPTEVAGAARLIATGVRAHLGRLSQERPVVLVLEDVHWADHATTELIENLARDLQHERLLLVCATRPDRRSRAWELLERLALQPAGEDARSSEARAEVLHVNALKPAQLEELLTELVQDSGLPPAVRAAILEKADGNPFYLEEVVRTLLDAGHIVNDGGRWRVTGGLTEVSLPGTLAGVIGARIDGLPEAERQVAQTASVIGREFAARLLRAVMEEPSGPPPGLDGRLGSLTVEGLITRVEQERFTDYRFKHEFTRDAAYQRLLRKRRRELHGRIGEEMELLFGDHHEIAKDLAHHYLLGERWFDAAFWSLEAARAARRLYQPADALKLTETALNALEKLGAGPTGGQNGLTNTPAEAAGRASERDPRALHVEVLNELIGLGVQMRQHEDPQLRPLLEERGKLAVELSRNLGDPRALVQSLVSLGNVYVLAGFPRTGFEWLMEANDLAAQLGEERLFLLPLWVATEIMLDDAPVSAVEQLDEVIAMARRVGNVQIEAHALGSKTAALARIGEFEEALRTGPQALAAAEASDSVIKQADVNMLFGLALLEMGQLRPGIQHLTQGTDLALSVNGFECACNGLHLLGVGHLQHAEIEEALSDLVRSLETGRGTAMEGALHNVRASLATAQFMSGQVEALETLAREIENAETLNDGLGAARGRLALSEALVAQEKGEQAATELRKVLGWVENRGMLPYAMRGYRLLASALQKAGDPEGSLAAAARADALAGDIHWPDVLGAPGPRAAGASITGAATDA